ncbi:MAG TPA: DivIVA domain-containing protein [Acidimicrobiales bacterium]|jgi:DivIVA domain-containing protein|nr:DivIVA domain-containing protein [Acidimicrobiales bacterium]
MDASQSALDSLRTVEFRETLKGYHRDDVDEYLERAAVEAEGLQEQLRQSGERLRQAAERISQLETALEQKPAVAPQVEAAPPDDTLQRTLLLAQKFVDETKADSEAQAARILAEADAKARQVTEQAQSQASRLATESEQRLREEIGRLEDARGRLTHEVETMNRHLEGERHRLRTALSEILRWVDENVQAATTGETPRTSPGASPASPAATPAAPQGAAAAATPAGTPATVVHGGNRPVAGTPQAAPAPSNSGTGPSGSGEVTQMRPGGATTTPANTNAPLSL